MTATETIIEQVPGGVEAEGVPCGVEGHGGLCEGFGGLRDGGTQI